MPIAAVQKNQSVATSTNSPMPAWGSTTTAGNLLLIIANKVSSGTWTTPAGYTVVAGYPFLYHSVQSNTVGVYWRIAAGGDATPPIISSTGASAAWIVWTYEFSAPTGWLATPNDQTAHSIATSTATTTKASGSLTTLQQANELVIAVCALNVAGTSLTFGTSSFTLDQPGSPDGRLWLGWVETAATTGLGTTATWTGAQVACCLVAPFATGAASTGTKNIRRTRRVGSGR